MPSFEFTGGDPIDHFLLGRVEPGQIVEADVQPPGPWKATKRRPKRAQSADKPQAGTEHGSGTPDPAEED